MAKYVDIANDLRDQIRAGGYPVGTALPGLTDLKERYGVSLNTVRGAQDLLRREGLLRIAQGEGAFVIKAPEWRVADILASLHTARTSLDAAINALERHPDIAADSTAPL
ncbi:GntR family transcriptional regulator [Dactylosporangium sp. AC04546]|uniref:GntR family transcriptional regulator n=1 Tax=Dactylosporangium sp. AC04546 TaxID=2862460 RepID=UPI001EE054D8|nr:GntR family transcriptional regulator [Dactylosporangium sp. AC04546]WVK80479.1 GntR family transcriptional regulator [Dactylosporangium sp. AC04546]